IKHTDQGDILPAQVLDNRIDEISVSPYVEARVRWTRWLETLTGVRADLFRFAVNSPIAANSGSRNAGLVTPKLGVVLGPWRQTELYVNGGSGFHSNHANGVLQRVDPTTGTTLRSDGQLVTPTAPIVRTRGAELGARTAIVSGLQSSLSLWIIDSDSE